MEWTRLMPIARKFVLLKITCFTPTCTVLFWLNKSGILKEHKGLERKFKEACLSKKEKEI